MKSDSICWDCQRAVCGCSWAKKLKPVEGWIAEENKLGYKVLECPLFVEDYKPVKMPELANIVGVETKKLYRTITRSDGEFDYYKLKRIMAKFGYEIAVYRGKRASIFMRKMKKCHDI